MSDAWTLRMKDGRRVLVCASLELPIPYSPEFLARLGEFRPGLDLVDEVLRSEHGPYIHQRLAAVLAKEDVGTWTVLDFGCGAGASAVCLARLGVKRIIGVDLVNSYAHVWNERLRQAGFEGIGQFVQTGDSLRLPFRSNQFDAVLLNGLMEHLLPEERVGILRETLRVVKRSRYLILTETPNRRFFRNSHTKLWFSELLPLHLAARLAATFGPRDDFPTRERTAIYRTGMRGESAGRIRQILGPAAEVRGPSTEVVEMEFAVPRSPLQSTPRKERFGRALLRIYRVWARVLGIPLWELAPHLNCLVVKR